MRRFWLIVSGATIVLILAAFGVFIYYVNTHQNPKVSQNTTATPMPSVTSTPKTYPVNVYFSKHTESDNDPSKTFSVQRTSPNLGVGNYAMTELLKGPNQQEQTAGYFSQVRLRNDTSNCGGADYKLSINNGVVTLQFCKTFDHIGSVSDGQAESEINATLKQFDGIKKVIILNKSGDCEFNLSGLNLCKQ